MTPKTLWSGGLGASLSQRPLLVVLAGPNGSGKTTFFHAYLAPAGLRFVNADVLARDLGLEARQGGAAADAVRATLIEQGESFVTETVFSDPAGAKWAQFEAAVSRGYTVLLVFISVGGPDVCDERVAMRVSQGGHDVPPDRLVSRYPRVMDNLRSALERVPHVLVYNNGDLSRPFRFIARAEVGRVVEEVEGAERPTWWVGVRGTLASAPN